MSKITRLPTALASTARTAASQVLQAVDEAIRPAAPVRRSPAAMRELQAAQRILARAGVAPRETARHAVGSAPHRHLPAYTPGTGRNPLLAAGAGVATAGAEAAILSALTMVVMRMLEDPEVRREITEAATAKQLRHAVASGVYEIAPAVINSLKAMLSRKCACGHEAGAHHKGAKEVLAKLEMMQRSSLAPSHHARSVTPGTGRNEMLGSGNLEADILLVWQMMAKQFYGSADLTVLAVREALQNSVDAMIERYKAGGYTPGESPEFHVNWTQTAARDYERRTPALGTLILEDNGVGMAPRDFQPTSGEPLSKRLKAFIKLGGTVKDADAFGGFGAAKAVILGAASTGWRLHTGWVLMTAPSASPDKQFDVQRASTFHQGVRLELYGVEDTGVDSPYTFGSYSSAVERIEGMLELNKLPGIRMVLNDRVVEYRYDGSRSTAPSEWQDMKWSSASPPAATAKVRCYVFDDAGTTQARESIRLRRHTPWGEAFLVQNAFMTYFSTRQDIFIDLTISVKPQDTRYPLQANREGFTDRTAKASLREIENTLNDTEKRERALEKARRLKETYEDIAPDSEDPRERAATHQIDEAISKAFDGLEDELSEVFKDMKTYQLNDANYDGEDFGTVNERPEGLPVERNEEPTVFEQVISNLGNSATSDTTDVARAIKNLVEMSGVQVSWGVEDTLQDMSHGVQPTTAQAEVLIDALDDVNRALAENTPAEIPSLLSARAVAATADALINVTDSVGEAEQKRLKKRRSQLNPFGSRAFIRINREMPKETVATFKKNYKKYVPLLAAWDSVLKLVARAGRMEKAFTTGFVLEKGVRAIALNLPTPNGKIRSYVLVNPLAFDGYIKPYPNRPDLIAQYLVNLAVHEAAHIPTMADGHGEEFSRYREDLGLQMAPALGLIETIVARLFKMKIRKRIQRGSSPEFAKKLQDELEKARKMLAACQQERDLYQEDYLNLSRTRGQSTSEVAEWKARAEEAQKARDLLAQTQGRLADKLALAEQEQKQYRSWVTNSLSTTIHTLFAELDRHQEAQTFADWLASRPAPAEVDANLWTGIISMVRRNPDLSEKLQLFAGMAPHTVNPFSSAPTAHELHRSLAPNVEETRGVYHSLSPSEAARFGFEPITDDEY